MSVWTMDRRQLLAMTGAALLGGVAHAATPFEDRRLARFNAAKFGMFVHWGPYSIAGVEASWPIMIPDRRWPITEADYVRLPQRFEPRSFDPDQVIDAAKAAGQHYIVFTTKHHDGFCMFDSAYTDYKVTRTPYGKDVVKLLADACARRGMPLGFYYSPPDMHHPGFRDTRRPASTNWRGQPERPEWSSYLDYMALQLTELLTRYGEVATIWFDGLDGQEKYDGWRFVDLIRRLQPSTLINDRIGVPGDYLTPEQFIPRGIPVRGNRTAGADASVQSQFKDGVPPPGDFQPWEACMTINDTWGYNARDRAFKTSETLIASLVEVAAKGGNMLLNVGPQPTGSVQLEFTDRLAAVGRWLAVNGEAIYDTSYGPLQGRKGYRTTAKGDAIYVHLLAPHSASLTLEGLTRPVRDVRLLADKRPLPYSQQAEHLTVDLGAIASDAIVPVVRIVSA